MKKNVMRWWMVSATLMAPILLLSASPAFAATTDNYFLSLWGTTGNGFFSESSPTSGIAALPDNNEANSVDSWDNCSFSLTNAAGDGFTVAGNSPSEESAGTNDMPWYALPNLPPGSYTLSPICPSWEAVSPFQFQITYSPAGSIAAVTAPASVLPGSDVTISGKILDQGGFPLPSSTVSISFGGSTQTVTTDSNGNFSVSLAAPNPTSTQPYSYSISDGAATASGSITVEGITAPSVQLPGPGGCASSGCWDSTPYGNVGIPYGQQVASVTGIPSYLSTSNVQAVQWSVQPLNYQNGSPQGSPSVYTLSGSGGLNSNPIFSGSDVSAQYVQVKAQYEYHGVWSPWSSPVNFWSTPDSVTGLTASATDNSITVSWPYPTPYPVNIITAPWTGNWGTLNWTPKEICYASEPNAGGCSTTPGVTVSGGQIHYTFPATPGSPVAVAINPSTEPNGGWFWWYSPADNPMGALNPPQVNNVAINGGAATTTTTNAQVTINASESAPSGGAANPPANITQMCVANALNSSGQLVSPHCQGYTSSAINWTITPTNGTDTVYVQVQDSAGNWSSVAEGQIYMNMTEGSTPPTVTLSINGGASSTTSQNVTLGVGLGGPGTFTTSGWQMRFSNDGQNWSSWATLASTASWSLPSGPGSDTVYAQVQNPNGAIGTGSATIVYQPASQVTTSLGSGGSLTSGGGTTGGSVAYPSFISLNTGSGSAMITTWSIPGVPQGAAITSTPGVTFNFSPSQTPSEMRTAADGSTFGPWVPYQPSTSITLPNTPGIQSPAVQFKLANGTETPAYTLPVVYDPLAPKVSAAWQGGVSGTKTGSATLLLTVSDPYVPAQDLYVSVNGGGKTALSGYTSAGGNTYEVPVSVASGKQQVNVTITDPIGNATTVTEQIWGL